jgi:predicted HAD superfamily Cof-like phosphohydrolase
MKVFKDQLQFMTAGDIKEASDSKVDRKMALDCVVEEYQEWINEVKLNGGEPSIDELKEMIDLIYVCAQYLNVCIGSDIAVMLWDTVHEHNMSKLVDGKVRKRADGKVLKPEGFDKYAWVEKFKTIMGV